MATKNASKTSSATYAPPTLREVHLCVFELQKMFESLLDKHQSDIHVLYDEFQKMQDDSNAHTSEELEVLYDYYQGRLRDLFLKNKDYCEEMQSLLDQLEEEYVEATADEYAQFLFSGE